jgi:hypothetical protein
MINLAKRTNAQMLTSSGRCPQTFIYDMATGTLFIQHGQYA